MSDIEQDAPALDESPATGEQYGKAGLVFFGVLQVLFGAFFLLAVVAMALKPSDPNSASAQMGPDIMVPMLGVNLVFGAWLVTMGVGSIMARRWARALIVASSWVWLLTGIGSLLWFLAVSPDMSGEMIGDQVITPQMASTMKYTMYGTIIVIMMLIPGVLLLYYSSRQVREIVQHRDPVHRWTDNTPMPVLVLCGLCLVELTWVLSAYNSGWVAPFFGTVLTGIPAISLYMISGVLTVYATWQLYKLNPTGWKTMLGLTLFWSVSMAATFMQVGLGEFFAMLDSPAGMTERMEQMARAVEEHETLLTLQFVVTALAFLGYLIYTKRYFKRSSF